MTGASDARALAATHEWFEVNSGWAPPDPDTLADWSREGACRAPDDCWVARAATCPHGLVSWAVVLEDLRRRDRQDLRHREARRAGFEPTHRGGGLR